MIVQPPIHALTGLGVALIAVLGYGLVAGCSRGSSEFEGVVETPPTPEEIAAERKAVLEQRVKANIGNARNMAAITPDDHLGNIDIYGGMLLHDRGTKL